MLSSSQQQVTLHKLLEDLKTQPKLCSLDDYQGITLDVLNQHLKELGPLENPYFGLLYYFCVEENLLIPTPMFVYNRGKIVAKIITLLGEWCKWNPSHGGRVTTSQGAFIIGPNRDVRMPDVACTPRTTDRNLTLQQQWTYRGESFAPSFVVEVDTLTGPHSQFKALDYKMKQEYFQHGVDLGWLIDPEHKIMMVYQRYSTERVYRVGDTSWRDLTGGNVLPGFVVEAVTLDMVLNQEPGSSDEEELERAFVCYEVGCEASFKKRSQIAAHVEWHRAEIAKQKYLQHRH